MRPLLVLEFLMEYDKGVYCHPYYFLFKYLHGRSSVLLSQSGIGCHSDHRHVCINHVIYADDLCLMASCAIALQELINLCYEYSIGIDMNCNALKSYYIAFTIKLYKLTLHHCILIICPYHILVLLSTY